MLSILRIFFICVYDVKGMVGKLEVGLLWVFYGIRDMEIKDE